MLRAIKILLLICITGILVMVAVRSPQMPSQEQQVEEITSVHLTVSLKEFPTRQKIAISPAEHQEYRLDAYLISKEDGKIRTRSKLLSRRDFQRFLNSADILNFRVTSDSESFLSDKSYVKLEYSTNLKSYSALGLAESNGECVAAIKIFFHDW